MVRSFRGWCPKTSVAAADARINVAVSIGVAVLGQHGNDLFELLAAATWRCTGPRTPAAIRFGYTPTPPGTLQKDMSVVRSVSWRRTDGYAMISSASAPCGT